ncbi:MAG: cytidylate kinase-like family protein [Ignavibacteriales bacterium]|nr:cytidylate kinase-like family protein [Ignavibacteriales bacterium]
MKILSAYEKARVYIDKQSAEDEKTRKRKLNPGPTITLSRETGIGATEICEKLVEHLNQNAVEDYNDWAYFDRDLIEKVMRDHNLPEHFRKFLYEEKSHRFDSWVGELIGVNPSKLLLLHKTAQTILKLAEYGNVIIVGRGANIITSNSANTFHVRLAAPLNYRIENAMRLYHLNHKIASDFIRSEDDARKDYIWKYFHKDIDDPLLYHSVINTNLLKAEEIAGMIAHCVVSRFPKFFSRTNWELLNAG